MRIKSFDIRLGEERQVNGGLARYRFGDFDLRTLLRYGGGKLHSHSMSPAGFLAFGTKRLLEVVA